MGSDLYLGEIFSIGYWKKGKWGVINLVRKLSLDRKSRILLILKINVKF